MATLIALFTAAAGIQLICWIIVGACLQRREPGFPEGSHPTEGISVIVAAHNAAGQLPHLLSALQEQTYSNFEVVIVDDRSSDLTQEVIRTAAAQDSTIRLEVNRGEGKKAALATGIRSASNELLAFTDADCRPQEDWLRQIARHHSDSDELVVVGYGPYRAQAGFLNRLVRYETLHTALLMITAIRLRRPYMAVGRNLSYRKSTFERVGGFEQDAELLSGDDDLFVQAAWAGGIPVRFMGNADTFVYSEAPHDFRSWMRQKRRHLSTGRRYNKTSQLALLAYHVSAMLCWMAPFALGWLGFGVLVCRLIPGQVAIAQASSEFDEPRLSRAFIPLDLAFQIYLLVVAPVAWFRAPRRW